MKSVTVELPDETFAAARRSPPEVARDMRLALAALWYEQGLVSQGMAARIADLSRGEFMKAISRIAVSPFQESLEDVRDALND
jgi:predicted HTH domain antitoxin